MVMGEIEPYRTTTKHKAQMLQDKNVMVSSKYCFDVKFTFLLKAQEAYIQQQLMIWMSSI